MTVLYVLVTLVLVLVVSRNSEAECAWVLWCQTPSSGGFMSYSPASPTPSTRVSRREAGDE
jgi:hypothetical protein